MTGIVQCPECNGVTGAHSITCPTIVQSQAVPPASVQQQQAPKTCASCGATGYHKAACPTALVARPEMRAERPDFRRIIAKVLQVDRDTGHTASPSNLTDQIVAELLREGWEIR